MVGRFDNGILSLLAVLPLVAMFAPWGPGRRRSLPGSSPAAEPARKSQRRGVIRADVR